VIHATADVHPSARVGATTNVWRNVQIRDRAVVGEGCNLGKDVFIDTDVLIGSNVKLQNGVYVYKGVTLEDGVFVGPNATFTNDKYPRAINPDGSLKGEDDWAVVPTLVRYGASIGGGATIVCGVTVGRWASVAAGALVTRDVPDHGLVLGAPARLAGYVCRCGRPLLAAEGGWSCPACSERYDLPPLPPGPGGR
jgi:acetyltransferase-like isoleucine patch superfamily enzyme